MICRMYLPCPSLFALDITPLHFSHNGHLDKIPDLGPQVDTRHLNIKIPVIRTRHLMYTVTTLYEQYIICYLNPKQSHIKKLQRESKMVRSKN